VRTGYAFIALPVLLILVFRVLPVFISFVISFTEYDIIRPAHFRGLANFKALIRDDLFWNALYANLYYTAGTVFPTLFLGLVTALVLFTNWFKAKWLFRTLFFIPVILSMTVVALVFGWLLDPTFGALNYFLSFFGAPQIGWLADPNLAMPSIIAISIWKGIGYSMVLYLAALTSIPETVYEAAHLDGVNTRQKFLYITWPLLMPTTLFIAVTGVIGSFQVFDSVYLLTGGGPINRTRVLTFYLWQQAFQYLRMGFASAMAWFIFILIFVFTLLQFRSYGKGVEY
jgi:ABC-type sugar transport system permease subunit